MLQRNYTTLKNLRSEFSPYPAMQLILYVFQYESFLLWHQFQFDQVQGAQILVGVRQDVGALLAAQCTIQGPQGVQVAERRDRKLCNT